MEIEKRTEITKEPKIGWGHTIDPDYPIPQPTQPLLIPDYPIPQPTQPQSIPEK